MAKIPLKQELVESNTCDEREQDWSPLKCIVCKLVFKPQDKSYLLECLHPVCEACLPGFVDTASSSTTDVCPRQCPGCRVSYQCPSYIENKFIKDLLLTQDFPEDVDDIKCSNHPETMASDWCDTCAAFICEICVTAHKHLKPTKDHTIKSKAEYIETLKEKKPQRCFPCSEHPKEFLTVFCSSCNMMTCRDCQLTKHRAHDYSFLSEIANSTRELLQSFKNEIESKRYEVDAQMVTVREIESQISQRKSKLLNDIKDIVLRLTEVIRKKGTELMMEVDEICQTKILEMSQKKETLENNLRQINHCSNFVRNALEMASDPVLVYSKEHVVSRLNHLKECASSLHNLNIAFSMELQTSNIDEFVKALSRFAKIKSETTKVVELQFPSEGSDSTSDADHITRNPQHAQQLQLQPQQRVNNQDHFLVPSYLFDGVNQGLNHQYPPLSMRQPQQVQVAPGIRYSPNGVQATIRHNLPNISPQTFVNQPQPSNCSMVRDNSPSLDWGSWPTTHAAQSSNYRQSAQALPAQNVMRVAANQQVTSTSNLYKPVDMAHSSRGQIIRIESVAVPTSPRVRGGHVSKMYATHSNMLQMNRQVPPGMVQNRYIVCRNYGTTRTSPPWAGLPNSNRNIVKHPAQQRTNTQGVSWHIPQTETTMAQQHPIAVACTKSMQDSSFKILLTKSKTPPTVPTPTSVSSSAPETPVSNPQNRPEVAEALDTLCQASLDDVLRTLSDLDKDIDNSITHKRDSVVHSSTGSASHSESGTPQPTVQQKNPGEWQKEDPNEDWCAVCMDGGELVCCDNCPKVFHITCHIPALPRVPHEVWQCTLCRDITPLPYAGMNKHSGKGHLTDEEHSVCERILLELYCQYDCSLHFREPIPPENIEYHKVIHRPMCLDLIRKKLTMSDPSHFCSVRQFINEIRLVFRNAFTFNPIGSQVYADGMTLEEFLETLLTKFLPLFAHTNLHDDLNSDDDDDPVVPVKKTRRIVPD
uniref:E3 ubiquitin-protein ligase TRIM33 n=4 Tax=Lygus hesperus TaxID=30085 RepID=A0A0A9ZDP7_LYGHE